MMSIIVVSSDNHTHDTMTVSIGKAEAGHALRIKDDDGRVWYGKVDDDGIALLTRSDLLPKRKYEQ